MGGRVPSECIPHPSSLRSRPFDPRQQLGKRQFEAGQYFATEEDTVSADLRPLAGGRAGPRGAGLGLDVPNHLHACLEIVAQLAIHLCFPAAFGNDLDGQIGGDGINGRFGQFAPAKRSQRMKETSGANLPWENLQQPGLASQDAKVIPFEVTPKSPRFCPSAPVRSPSENYRRRSASLMRSIFGKRTYGPPSDPGCWNAPSPTGRRAVSNAIG